MADDAGSVSVSDPIPRSVGAAVNANASGSSVATANGSNPASSWLLMIYAAGVVLLVVAGRNVFVSASVVLGWAIASIVAAVLLNPLVVFLDRALPRALAIIVVFLAVAGIGLGVRSAYVAELKGQVDYLAERGPEIAERVEARDDRVGEIAREIELVDRVSELTERLQDQVATPADALRDAAMAVPAYLVAFILTIFFLVFGPQMVNAGFARLGDERGPRLRDAAHRAADATQLQVGAALVLATIVGMTVWIVATVVDAPAPGLFGLAGAAASFVPYVGISVAFLPVIVVSLGVGGVWDFVGIFALACVMQYLEATRWRPLIDRRSLYVGPAAIVITGALGFAVYGFGGMVVLVVIAVFALAVADQVATDDPENAVDADEELDPIPTPIDEYVEPEPETETDADTDTDADTSDA